VKLLALLWLMGSKVDVVKGLAKRWHEHWIVTPEFDMSLYLSDIQDHLVTMTDNMNHYEKILYRSHANYLAQVSIEMTHSNNKINYVLSKLTFLTVILLPMNVVTSLWSMNVWVPGEGNPTFGTFGGIIASLFIIAASGTIWLKRMMKNK